MIYVEVEFRPGGKRYAYGYSGDAPIEPYQDRVEIQTREGLFTFLVLGVSDRAPDRELRMIERVIPRHAADPDPLTAQ